MQKLGDQERRALQRMHVLPHWTDVQQERYYDSARASLCPHWGTKALSELHLWEFHGLKEFRENLDKDLASLTPSNTPQPFTFRGP